MNYKQKISRKPSAPVEPGPFNMHFGICGQAVNVLVEHTNLLSDECIELNENIKNTSGLGHGFMKDFPGIILANDRASGKNDHLGEIDMERASYLLNIDDILEEMLSLGLVTHGYF